MSVIFYKKICKHIRNEVRWLCNGIYINLGDESMFITLIYC